MRILFLIILGISFNSVYAFKIDIMNIYHSFTKTQTPIPTKRRITNLEKKILNSKQAKKVRFNGRIVVKRRVFKCTPSNIAKMKKGKAPIGFDGKKVELHHLKQQKNGELVEMTKSEHNGKNYKTLHRYTKISEIDDRNTKFAKFREDWWKNRANDCRRKSF